jgi:hypothetical protein
VYKILRKNLKIEVQKFLKPDHAERVHFSPEANPHKRLPIECDRNVATSLFIRQVKVKVWISGYARKSVPAIFSVFSMQNKTGD